MKSSKTTQCDVADCTDCNAVCCRDLASMILRPTTRKEIDDLKWEIQFDTVKVYIQNHRWYQWVKGNCMYLGPDSRCTIYADRPDRCRNHNPPNCEKYGEFYDHMFNTPEELEAFLRPKKKKRK